MLGRELPLQAEAPPAQQPRPVARVHPQVLPEQVRVRVGIRKADEGLGQQVTPVTDEAARRLEERQQSDVVHQV